ncbi:MAG: S8 family serine peptidase [Verrucomicrobiota bacterium]
MHIFIRRIGWFLVLAATSLSAAPHKIRVHDRAQAEALQAQGAKTLADYGSFQVLQVESLPATRSLANPSVRSADDYDRIKLNATTLDTAGHDKLAMRRNAAVPAAGKNLRLVQFVGPIKPEWRLALIKTGVRIVHYLPSNAYLVYANGAVLEGFEAWATSEPAVQFTGDYTGDLKVHPEARPAKLSGVSSNAPGQLYSVQLVDDDGNAATLQFIERIRLGPVLRSSVTLGYRNMVVTLPPGELDALAALPDVVSIHRYYIPQRRDERQDQIVAGNLSGNSPNGPGYLAWLAGKGFTQEQFDASGLVVDVSDSGVENGTTVPAHFALYPEGNVSLLSRVVYNRFERTVNNSGATLSGCDGHGTLNAHIIGGYSAFTGGVHSDASGFRYGLGVCPFVKIGSSVVFDNSSSSDFTDPNYATLLTHAYNSGARISNNSWGSAASGEYDADAQAYDGLVRDVGNANLNRPMLVVFAAGNEGPGLETMDSPGTAKNVLTVGATENVRSINSLNGGTSSTGEDGCGTLDVDADSANDVLYFSSRGPCADGRFKPDLMAPGSHIVAGAPQSGSPSTNGTGSVIGCFNGSGVCGLKTGGNFFPPAQQLYTVSSGTSHATPAVAGACALVWQYFINEGLEPGGGPPSPAMTKAFLMNSARFMTGNGAGGSLPSPHQGMGAVNLGTAFDGVPRVIRDQLSDDVITNTGQSRVFSGFVSDPSKPFRVTLVWTDVPGSTAASQVLVNDLDLRVTIGGVTYLGNVFSGRHSAAGGSADSLNNVESVFLPAGFSGPFVVTVEGANVSENAIVRSGALPAQDFALVVYNASLTPQPAVSLNGYSVVSESCSPANAALDPGETVTVSFNFQNLGTANTADLRVTLLETNGVVSPGGEQIAGVLVTNGPAVSLSFTFTAAGGCGDVVTPTFSLKDDGEDLGMISVEIPLGTAAPLYVQNFDGVTAPSLPPWWSTSRTGSQSLWVVSKKSSDTAPNAAFAAEPGVSGLSTLVSPVIPLPSGRAQLTFRHSFNTESGFDGGVLEIKIGTSGFSDILDAGGSFVAGGYNKALRTSAGSSLVGRPAWTGNSGGFHTTTVTLPAAASTNNVQFRWRCNTDSGTAGSGWFIDGVQVSTYFCCPDEAPQPPFVPAAANYNGLFYDTNGIQVVSSGSISVAMTGRGAYTGTLRLGASRYAFAGTFGPLGTASNNIARVGATALKVSLRMDTSDNGRITGTINGGTWLASVDAQRSTWNALTHPAPYVGKYSVIFPGAGDPNNTSQPQGDGYGTLTVSTAGKIAFSGTLGDNTSFSQTATVSENGIWPLYASINSGKGQILGWLTFSDSVPRLAGVCDWIKQPIASSKFYPAGFALQTNAIGSKYVAPVTGAPLLNFNPAMLTLSGGNVFDVFAVTATNKPSAPLVYRGTNKLTLTLNSPTSALFKGSLVNPATGRTVSFKGAVLQDQQTASGLFVGTNQTGKVSFSP